MYVGLPRSGFTVYAPHVRFTRTFARYVALRLLRCYAFAVCRTTFSFYTHTFCRTFCCAFCLLRATLATPVVGLLPHIYTAFAARIATLLRASFTHVLGYAFAGLHTGGLLLDLRGCGFCGWLRAHAPYAVARAGWFAVTHAFTIGSLTHIVDTHTTHAVAGCAFCLVCRATLWLRRCRIWLYLRARHTRFAFYVATDLSLHGAFTPVAFLRLSLGAFTHTFDSLIVAFAHFTFTRLRLRCVSRWVTVWLHILLRLAPCVTHYTHTRLRTRLRFAPRVRLCTACAAHVVCGSYITLVLRILLRTRWLRCGCVCGSLRAARFIAHISGCLLPHGSYMVAVCATRALHTGLHLRYGCTCWFLWVLSPPYRFVCILSAFDLFTRSVSLSRCVCAFALRFTFAFYAFTFSPLSACSLAFTLRGSGLPRYVALILRCDFAHCGLVFVSHHLSLVCVLLTVCVAFLVCARVCTHICVTFAFCVSLVCTFAFTRCLHGCYTTCTHAAFTCRARAAHTYTLPFALRLRLRVLDYARLVACAYGSRIWVLPAFLPVCSWLHTAFAFTFCGLPPVTVCQFSSHIACLPVVTAYCALGYSSVCHFAAARILPRIHYHALRCTLRLVHAVAGWIAFTCFTYALHLTLHCSWL